MALISVRPARYRTNRVTAFVTVAQRRRLCRRRRIATAAAMQAAICAPRARTRAHPRNSRSLAFASAAIAAGVVADPALNRVPLTELGPSERVVEVLVATTSNLLNGAVFGAFFGFVSGAWTSRSLGGAFAEAKMNGRSWGGISGVYAGLQTASKVIRNKEDRLNSVVGACGSGAAFSMKSGPRAAAQGCVSFAALSYFIDVFTTPKDGAPAKEDPMSPEVILRKKR